MLWLMMNVFGYYFIDKKSLSYIQKSSPALEYGLNNKNDMWFELWYKELIKKKW